ncbi:hypothetical protein [Aureibacter tunicatorum]|uniref:Uncharacterized protein n=1 Tax=Aureibacter tunicatorum TaxID=866807 RepID=A0AAE3XPS1_9BACT|nr:hypothetical protein [Aureibacter tunicatorum]MDR6240438.1 hypothetical protein [Aureibacter tunicatorum]BDD05683.1 hypothetical protein AUTU_31660 [Aureibacter tunicatorum]
MFAREIQYTDAKKCEAPASISRGLSKTPPSMHCSIPLQALFSREHYLSFQESPKNPFMSGVKDVGKLLDKYHHFEVTSRTLSDVDKFKHKLLILFKIEVLINEWTKENNIQYIDRFCYPNLHMQQLALREIQLERMVLMKQLKANDELMPAFFQYYDPTAMLTRREDEIRASREMLPVWNHLTRGGIRPTHDMDTSQDLLDAELMSNLSILLLTDPGKRLLMKVFEAQHARTDLRNRRDMDRVRRNLFLMNQKIGDSRQLTPGSYVSGECQYTDFSIEMPFAWETGRYMSPKSRFMRSPRPMEESYLTFHPPYLQLAVVLEEYLRLMADTSEFRGIWQAGVAKNYHKFIATECGLPEFSKMQELPMIDTLHTEQAKTSEWMLVEPYDIEESLPHLNDLEVTLPTARFIPAGQHPQASLMSGFKSVDIALEAAPSPQASFMPPLPEVDVFDASTAEKPDVLKRFDSPAFKWNISPSSDCGASELVDVTNPLEKLIGQVNVSTPMQGNRSMVFFLTDEAGNQLVLKFLKEGSFSEDASKEAIAANFLKTFSGPSLQSQSCTMVKPSMPSWKSLLSKLNEDSESKKLVSEYRTSLAKSLPFILVMERAKGSPLDVKHVNYGNSLNFMHAAGQLAFFEMLMGNHDRIFGGIYKMNLHYDAINKVLHAIDHIICPGGMSSCLEFAKNQRVNMYQEMEDAQMNPLFHQRLMMNYRSTFKILYQDFINCKHISLSAWVMNRSNSRSSCVHFSDRFIFELGFISSALHFLDQEADLGILRSHDFKGKDQTIAMFLEACAVVNGVTQNFKTQLEKRIKEAIPDSSKLLK